MSNIRASVRLEKSTVFAGEPIRCTITFTNTAPIHSAYSSALPILQTRGSGSARERWKETLPSQNRNNRTNIGPGADAHMTGPRGHKSTLSLHSCVSGKLLPPPGLMREPFKNAAAPGHKHKHSISIVSISGDSLTREELNVHGQPAASMHSGRRHGRSASLQILPSRTTAVRSGPLSGENSLTFDTCS